MNVEELIRYVERKLDMPRGAVLSKRRHRSVCQARQIACWMLKHHRIPEPGSAEIGQMLGLEESTVRYAIAQVDKRAKADRRLRELLAGMLSECRRIAWPELECARAAS